MNLLLRLRLGGRLWAGGHVTLSSLIRHSCPDFLGFTHFCDQTKSGVFVVGRVTIGKRMRATLKEIRAQLHKRRHEPVPVIGQWLNRLFRGYCHYYHVPGNTRRLDAFRREIIRAWRHALKRRSQRHRLNWERMIALARLFIPYLRELPMHPYPITRFGVKTQGRSRMR